jgi:eukaryotic-like serine/threonine-protein kinase
MATVPQPGAQTPQSGLGSTVTGSEEGRAFYQQRLSLLGFCMFVLAGGSWAVLALVQLFIESDAADGYVPWRGSGLTHLADALLSGALWLVARRGRRSAGVLHATDITVTLSIMFMFPLGHLALPDPVTAGFLNLLCFTTVMLARAIVVPSTPRRTLVLGLLGAAPVIASIVWRTAGTDGGVARAVAGACWTSVGIVLGTVASHTIFGLRREVARARVLGQYTLEAKIGEGGMGEVWRARHALLRRPTAVKLLPPGRAGEAAIRRFEREVQITAQLTHPSTVAVYDYGRTRDGVFYYAMELLEGTDLERLVVEHGPQPPGRVVHVLAQVCGALAEAHNLKLVHRDVKPANVLLLPRPGEQELAKVVDFGLVKELHEVGPAHTALTAANTITGTPLYLSPESIQDPESVTGASDIYALGAVGWFLLVGRPPFEGRTILEVCSKHLHVEPQRPSEALGRPLPRDLEDILLACLEKKPDRRPAGARAVRARLKTSSAAGQWTEELATRWWDDRAQRPRGSDGDQRVLRGERTLALEVIPRAIS